MVLHPVTLSRKSYELWSGCSYLPETSRKKEAVPVPTAGVDARGGEPIERRRQDVHHAGGKDDANGKRLDREEDVAVRAQRDHGTAEHQHASRPGVQDGRDGDQLELHGVLLVRPVRGGRALAAAAGHSLLREQEEPWEERLQGLEAVQKAGAQTASIDKL